MNKDHTLENAPTNLKNTCICEKDRLPLLERPLAGLA